MSFAKYLLGALILIVLLFVVCIKFYASFQDAVKVATVVNETEDQLGFDHYMPHDPERGGVKGYPVGDNAVFASIESGGLFDQAGFRSKDEVPTPYHEFFGQILLNQGKRISVPIIRDGESLVIEVDIPELYLSYDFCSFKVFDCVDE